jgi:Ca-activated chloride channel family protein
VELDRAVLPAGGRQTAIVKVTLDAPPPPETVKRPPVNLAIVLDRSGSMQGQKLEHAKEAAIEALRRLGPKDVFSLVVYDHNVRTVVPATMVVYSGGDDGRRVNFDIETKIRQIRAGGHTALFGGVSQGAAEIRKFIKGGFVNRIILLSDGLANVGPSTPEDLGRLGAAFIKEGISVTTVGVGVDYNEDLMTQLSQQSDGNSYFVESSADLPRIFKSELGDVLNVVAKRVHIDIQFPKGIKPIQIIGREGRVKKNSVELYLNQLYGRQGKYGLIEVELPGGMDGDSVKVADATATYENTFSRRKETVHGSVWAKFSSAPEEVIKSENKNVRKDHQLNLNAAAQEKAILLLDKGKKNEAVKTLTESARELKSLGNRYNDQVLLDKARQMESQAGQIEREGMTRKSRKVLRTDSYQMKNQQMSE